MIPLARRLGRALACGIAIASGVGARAEMPKGAPPALSPPARELPYSPPPAPPTPAPLWARDLVWQVAPSLDAYDRARPAGPAGDALGWATLLCQAEAEGTFSACRVEEEQPVGAGFGAAALSLVPTLRIGPATTGGEPVAGRAVRFGLRFPPKLPLLPPGARPARHPNWTSRPTSDELGRYYPKRALRAAIEGRAVLQCMGTKDGRLDGCVAIDEDPADYGFGEAALRLVASFQMAPLDGDGRPVAGAMVRVPVAFRLTGG
jgi:TonB family protein